jgi:FtsZ-binding cell division protein ZapB
VKDTDIIAAIAPDAVSLMDKAIAEIKRLRQENATLTAERDEARRTVCALDADTTEDQIEYAKHHGWDCYKENTDG